MNLTKRLDARLEPNEYERFRNGQPIQIPTGNAVIVLYPPEQNDESQQGESDTEYSDDDGFENLGEIEQ